MDEKYLQFDLLYCMVRDAKRWLRAGVLRRFGLLAAPRLDTRKLWEALPPLPATVMSHGGVLTWSSQRHLTGMQGLIGADTWLSFADAVVVQDSDLAACAAHGYACVPFPDDACQAAKQQTQNAQLGSHSAGQICGYSRQQQELLQSALVVFVPSDAVDLVETLLLPALQHPVVLISSEPDWSRQGGTGMPAFSPLDTVNFRFGPTANDVKVLRWFARGLTLENRYVSPLPAPMPPPITRALQQQLSSSPLPHDAALHAYCGPSASQAAQGNGAGSGAGVNSEQASGWLFIPSAHSSCADVASRPDWLLDVGAECRELPEVSVGGVATATSDEDGGSDGGVAGLVAAVARNRFCLLTEIDESEEYVVWLCLWLVPIKKL